MAEPSQIIWGDSMCSGWVQMPLEANLSPNINSALFELCDFDQVTSLYVSFSFSLKWG